MTIRTYVQKNGTIWEWEETPELLQIIHQNLDPNKTLDEFLEKDTKIP
jgi:hypothetical protein